MSKPEKELTLNEAQKEFFDFIVEGVKKELEKERVKIEKEIKQIIAEDFKKQPAIIEDSNVNVHGEIQQGNIKLVIHYYTTRKKAKADANRLLKLFQDMKAPEKTVVKDDTPEPADLPTS